MTRPAAPDALTALRAAGRWRPLDIRCSRRGHLLGEVMTTPAGVLVAGHHVGEYAHLFPGAVWREDLDGLDPAEWSWQCREGWLLDLPGAVDLATSTGENVRVKMGTPYTSHSPTETWTAQR